MDNLAHTLCGAALARTRLGKMSRLAPASLIVGANLPDLDIVSRALGGTEAYLVHHRGITHSFVGVVGATLLLAALIRFVEGRMLASGREGRGGVAPRNGGALPPWRAFLIPAFVALLSHLALDWLNNYGVRPFLPFSHERWFGDLVSIVDPLMWLIFGGIALLAGPRTRGGHVTWAAIGAFTLWIVWTHERSPGSVKAYWPFAVAGLATLRALGVGAKRPRRALVAGALVLAAYLGGLELSAQIAWRNALRQDDPQASIAAGVREPWRQAMRSPILANPFEWVFFLETRDAYWYREVDLRGRSAWPFAPYVRNLDDPRVREAAATASGAAWRYFARLPCAEVTERADGSTGSTLVRLYDARYRAADWCALTVTLPSATVR